MNIENSVDEIAVSFDNRASQISLKTRRRRQTLRLRIYREQRGIVHSKSFWKKVKKTLKNIAKIVDKRI